MKKKLLILTIVITCVIVTYLFFSRNEKQNKQPATPKPQKIDLISGSEDPSITARLCDRDDRCKDQSGTIVKTKNGQVVYIIQTQPCNLSGLVTIRFFNRNGKEIYSGPDYEVYVNKKPDILSQIDWNTSKFICSNL